MSGFAKATKKQQKGRVALVGPAGSGKTYTGLIFAHALSRGGRVAVIDTERGTASKYAGDTAPDGTVFDFDVLELETFEPEKYIRALADAAKEGFAAVLIDSLSHAWTGEGGILEQKDAMGGRFQDWAKLTPKHRKLIDAILNYPGHVVATMRAKTDYVISTNDKGKPEPKRIGLKPEQREGMEYEFDIWGMFDTDSTLTIEKSRCTSLRNKVIREPTKKVAEELLAWLDEGIVAPPKAPPPSDPTPLPSGAPADVAAALIAEIEEAGKTGNPQTVRAKGARVASAKLPEELVKKIRAVYQRVITEVDAKVKNQAPATETKQQEVTNAPAGGEKPATEQGAAQSPQEQQGTVEGAGVGVPASAPAARSSRGLSGEAAE
jgi:hypothetical protein